MEVHIVKETAKDEHARQHEANQNNIPAPNKGT